MEDTPDSSDGLKVLEFALARDFARLNHPPADWVQPRTGPAGQRMVDVAIIGGGMCGLVAAFALRRLGISRIRHVDRQPEGLEGPWLTQARMRSLRSPKHLTGPAMGLPNLTFRAWWEARGDDWEALDRIGRTDWMDYLRWYRRATGAGVENCVAVTALRPNTGGVEIEQRSANGTETLTARRVVLATGRDGQAAPRVPAPLRPYFGTLVRHTCDDIDFAALRAKRVAVIGLAASAFDNAATALEAGASAVTMIGRAPALPRLNKMKQTVYPGFTHGFAVLPDNEKLALLDHVVRHRIAPPRGSVQRISADPRMTLILGAGVTGAAARDGALTLQTKQGPVTADLVVLATGFAIDLDAAAETAGFSGRILRWGDRVAEATDEWAQFPYLGPGFEFLPRDGARVPGLGHIHCFSQTAQLSLGNLSNDIPSVSEGADLLARAVAVSLFLDDRAWHRQRLHDYDEPELIGDEWPGLDAWDPPVP